MRASNARPYILVRSAGYIVGATIGRPLLAAEAMRFKTLRIHLLRLHGYESADKTAAVRYRACVVKFTAVVRGALASP